MDSQLTDSEIRTVEQLFRDYNPAQAAIATLEKHNGSLEDSFYELWTEKNGPPPAYDRKSLWEITLKHLRQEVCGDDSFRTKAQEYSKNPGSAPLLTGFIVSLLGMSVLPIDPAIATVIVLYILKIGLNIFCEYTEPPAADSGSQNSGN